MAHHAIVLIMMLISLEFSILLIICLVLWVCPDYWSNSWVHWPLTDTKFHAGIRSCRSPKGFSAGCTFWYTCLLMYTNIRCTSGFFSFIHSVYMSILHPVNCVELLLLVLCPSFLLLLITLIHAVIPLVSPSSLHLIISIYITFIVTLPNLHGTNITYVATCPSCS